MTSTATRTGFTLAFMLLAGFLAQNVPVSAGGAAVSAPSARTEASPCDKGVLGVHRGRRLLLHDHVVEHPKNSRRHACLLRSASGVPAGLLDSNVVLDAGDGNRALGRCTLDLTTGLGLCTFSDGIGSLAGFHARVAVDCTAECRWDGVYGFANVD